MKIDLKETNWRYYQFFDNGYGVSIVNIESDIFEKRNIPTTNNLELAVLKGTQYVWDICYDTPITEDVEKYLTEKELIKLIAKVKAFPKWEEE